MPIRLLTLAFVALFACSCSLLPSKQTSKKHSDSKRSGTAAAKPAASSTAGTDRQAPSAPTVVSKDGPEFAPPLTPAAAPRPASEKPAEPAKTEAPAPKAPEPKTPGPAAQPPPQPAPPGGTLVGTVVAVVNGDIITQEDVLRDIRPELAAIDRDDSLTAIGKNAKRSDVIANTVVRKIERLLALQEARRTIPDEQAQRVEADVDTLIKSTIRLVGTLTRLQGMMAAEGQTIEAQKKIEVDNRLIRLLLDREVDGRVYVTPGEMLRCYDDHEASYRRKKEVQIREIYISYANVPAKEDAVKKAGELLERIRKGEDFGKLAAQYSEGPQAKKEGLWDFATEGTGAFRPEVEKAAFSLGPKEVSGCLTSQIGAHIIKVEDVRPARVVPFAEVQEDIGAKLRAGKRQALYRQFIDKLREKSYVEVLWK